jgi:ankyrin repeat protein
METQQEQGLTALHYAAWNGHVLCVQILCANDRGRDKAGLQASCIDICSMMGLTALHVAASDGINSSEVIESLLAGGANRTIIDHCGKSPLALAKERGKEDCVRKLSDTNYEKPGAVAAYRKLKAASLRVQCSALAALKVPLGLAMQEHEILPLSKSSFAGPHVKQTIQSLVHAADQAELNLMRRQRLLLAHEPVQQQQQQQQSQHNNGFKG